MSMARDRSGARWVLMRLRGLGFGRNPIRRGVDRLQSVIVLGAVLVGVLMIPAGVALGGAVRDASEEAAAQRRAVLTETSARTLEDSEQVEAIPGQVWSRVRVGWTDAGGLPREGLTDVRIGTKSGSEVRIWLDQSGAIARPPRPADDSAALGTAVALTAVMTGWLILPGLARLALIPLNRCRSRGWEREWEQLDKRWKHPQN